MSDAPVDAPVALGDRGPGRRTALVVAVLLAIVVAALVVLLGTRDTSGERSHQSPLFGQLAPETAGRTLDGGEVSLADHRGRWVVVNFFASWCTPCIVEHPELQRFYEAHRETGDATLIAVTYDNRASDAREFFAERGGDWPVIDDPENRIGVAYGVTQPPETFVIAPNGTVVQRFLGAVTSADLDAVIDAYEREAGT